MKRSTIAGLFLLQLVVWLHAPVTGHAQEKCDYCNEEVRPLVHPPADPASHTAWTREQVKEIVDTLVAQRGLRCVVRLLSTEAWEHYLNHHHFVPPTAEGHPEDFKFNGNWHADYASDPRQMTFAEVTESGELYLWWDAANYFSMSRADLMGGLKFAIDHEAIHYNQWRQLATEVVVLLGHGNPTAMPQTIGVEEIPSNLAELDMIPDAKEMFLRVWNDVGHYQCRELTAHWETSKDLNFATAFTTAAAIPQLQQWGDFMKVYRDGKAGLSPGCKNSVWKVGFAPDIANADLLIQRIEKRLKELTNGKK